MKRLIFVYNAESGLGNKILDTLHKCASPETYKCNLCSISHGVFGMKKEWKEFVESLPVKAVFLHKDEFLERYSPHKTAFPAIYLVEGRNAKLVSDLRKLGQKASLNELKDHVWSSLKDNNLV